MVVHIRYEVVKLIEFLRIGNNWVEHIEGLPAGLGILTICASAAADVGRGKPSVLTWNLAHGR